MVPQLSISMYIYLVISWLEWENPAKQTQNLDPSFRSRFLGLFWNEKKNPPHCKIIPELLWVILQRENFVLYLNYRGKP